MTPSAEPTLSVIIVAWNCREYLRRCLEALEPALAGLSAEIIVADNDSSDGTPALLRQDFSHVTLIEMGRNAGFAAAANRAAAQGRGQFLWLLNPDTCTSSDCPSALLVCLKERPRAGAAGPRLQDVAGQPDPRSARRFPTLLSEWVEKAGLRRLALHLTDLRLDEMACRPVPCVSGAAMLVRRSAWLALGGLDEAFFLYAEDLDFCRRLATAGWEVWYCGAAAITHVGGGSSGQQPETAGVNAILSMATYFQKHGGGLYGSLYRAGVAALSLLKLLACAPFAPFWAAARRKAALHCRLIVALASGARHV